MKASENLAFAVLVVGAGGEVRLWVVGRGRSRQIMGLWRAGSVRDRQVEGAVQGPERVEVRGEGRRRGEKVP